MAMSEEEKSSDLAPAQEPITVKMVEEEPAGEWKMPEPVFRRSSGALPKGFVRKAAAVAVPAQIQPQPDITEEFDLNDLGGTPAPPARRGNSALNITFVIVGILAMLAFAIVFLAVIYFLFFYQPDVNNNLN
jgi:hypothetical protein